MMNGFTFRFSIGVVGKKVCVDPCYLQVQMNAINSVKLTLNVFFIFKSCENVL